MFTRTFLPERFIGGVYGAKPFLDYCRRRGIPYDQVPDGVMSAGDYHRWTAALAQLPRERRGQVEWELAKVNELSGRESLIHLLAAVEGQTLPSDHIPGDASLALWFFLHHPAAFHQVFLHQEILEVETWRNAQARPGRVIEDLLGKADALAASLREFFQLRAGSGRFCAVDVYRLNGAYCFVAHVADRLQLFDGFTEEGGHTRQRLRPSFPVLFVYYPQDGTILLKVPLCAEDRLLELFQRFGRVVLGIDLAASSLNRAFALDRLKASFQPLPDAEDMESIRIKTLHFRYPERHGRRQVKLETVAGDESFAIARLMETHMSGEGVLDQMQVCYAELQILLRVEGQSKSYFIRLWSNRCNLNQGPLGERLRACLKVWGLYHE